MTFTGAAGSAFEQCYLFPSDIDYPLPTSESTATRISNQKHREGSFTYDNFTILQFKMKFFLPADDDGDFKEFKWDSNVRRWRDESKFSLSYQQFV